MKFQDPFFIYHVILYSSIVPMNDPIVSQENVSVCHKWYQSDLVVSIQSEGQGLQHGTQLSAKKTEQSETWQAN